jgi:hypothetical protein
MFVDANTTLRFQMAAKQSFAVASDLFLRLRFTEPKGRAACEFAFFPPARGWKASSLRQRIRFGCPLLSQAPSGRTWRAIRRVDQAPHQHGAGVRNPGYIPGARGFDTLLVGVYENKELIFVAKVKNGFVPRIWDELFPSLKALQTAQCHFRNLPEIQVTQPPA